MNKTGCPLLEAKRCFNKGMNPPRTDTGYYQCIDLRSSGRYNAGAHTRALPQRCPPFVSGRRGGHGQVPIQPNPDNRPDPAARGCTAHHDLCAWDRGRASMTAPVWIGFNPPLDYCLTCFPLFPFQAASASFSGHRESFESDNLTWLAWTMGATRNNGSRASPSLPNQVCKLSWFGISLQAPNTDHTAQKVS